MSLQENCGAASRLSVDAWFGLELHQVLPD
jgi:hypothetical protein